MSGSAPAPAGAAAATPQDESALRAFLRGLREPNLLSLGIALALGAAPLVAAPLAIDEDLMAGDHAFLFATGAADSTVHITRELLRAERAPSDRVHVYLFGPSTIRNSVDVPVLERDLRQLTGADVRVFGLASGLQRAIESLAMLDRLPPDASGVVVLSVGVHTLAEADEQMDKFFERPRIALRLSRLEAEAAKAGVPTPSRSSNYFWDNRHYFAPRAPLFLSNLFGGMPEYDAMPNRGKAPPTPEFLQRALRASLRRWREAGAMDAASTGVLERIVAAVAARPRLRLVLLEDTLNPAHAELPEFVEAVGNARRQIAAFASPAGVPYLQLQDRAGLTRDDFADAVHLRTAEGSRRYTTELAAEIAPLVREAADSLGR